jgi:hypothetical protein
MSEKKDSGIVNIHGKQYQTVAYRVGRFREAHPSYSLTTEIVNRDDQCAVMKATIADENGRVLATGHSEEYRHTSQINKTSALENAETSAIGRALAALGLGGTEFATADEVANAITQQHALAPKQKITPNAGAGDELDADQRKMVELTRDKIAEALSQDKDFDAYSLCESLTDDMLHEKLYLWSLLDSKQRRRIKNQAEKAKQPKAA